MHTFELIKEGFSSQGYYIGRYGLYHAYDNFTKPVMVYKENEIVGEVKFISLVNSEKIMATVVLREGLNQEEYELESGSVMTFCDMVNRRDGVREIKRLEIHTTALVPKGSKVPFSKPMIQLKNDFSRGMIISNSNKCSLG